jgi:hypothetical protein
MQGPRKIQFSIDIKVAVSDEMRLDKWIGVKPAGFHSLCLEVRSLVYEQREDVKGSYPGVRVT